MNISRFPFQDPPFRLALCVYLLAAMAVTMSSLYGVRAVNVAERFVAYALTIFPRDLMFRSAFLSSLYTPNCTTQQHTFPDSSMTWTDTLVIHKELAQNGRRYIRIHFTESILG